ncbi:MAG TPA: cytochrome C, partial [Chitinophagales bacterium]|nr:cytochrome C [Chitinophagales bacterium]
MKKTLKILFVVIVIISAAGIAYLKLILPTAGPTEDIKIISTPERIQHGKYLANHVAVCIDCHSQRDWTKFSGPLVAGTEGMGGEAFTKDLGFPGTFYAKNITPSEMGSWTDGALLHAISCGITKEKTALFPLMPYRSYGQLDKEDLLDIIAYLRTLKPIPNKVPASVPAFPFNLILNTIPTAAHFTKKPDKGITPLYGGYLVKMASCDDCHTDVINGKKVQGMDFAGGRVFNFPGAKKIISDNITPDKATGIGEWTEDMFVSKFKAYADTKTLADYKSPKDYQTVMPWSMYAGMDTVDLKAIYAYLKTL